MRRVSHHARDALTAVAGVLDDLDDPLEQLQACRELTRLLVGLEHAYARDAARHHTWAKIGDVVGISRQAAWHQYGSRSRARPQRPKPTTAT